MQTRLLIPALIAATLIPTAVRAQGNTERGAVLGGVGGALAGAAIGKQNDETAAGALIGGAIGLITGGAIGNAKDEEINRQRAYQEQMYWRMARAVSMQDVVTMTQNGLGEDVIINHIRQNGVQRQLEVGDVIALHQHGVSQRVIVAMQQAPLATAPVVPAPPYQRPIVVEQYHYVTPPSYHWSHGHHHHYHRYHNFPTQRSGFSWRVTFGH